MSQTFDFDRMQRVLNHCFANFSNGAVVTPEGDTLFVKYETLTDLGTFSSCALTTHHYLQLQDGDVVITNDPYSGGSTVFAPNLVMAVQPKNKGGKSQPLLMVIRLDFKPHLRGGRTLDEEGLRIPPTPLRQNNQLNLAIVEAMAGHPMAPEHLQDRLLEAVQHLTRLRQHFLQFTQKLHLDWSKQNQKSFLKASKQGVLHWLSELANGEKRVDLRLKSGALLRLHMEISGDKVKFDFSGTDQPADFALTDSGTFGACAGALASVLRREIPLNSGFFSLIDLVAPQGSLVNAQFPQPTFEGMTDGAAVVANQVVKCIGEIDTNRQVALSSTSQCAFDIEFSSHQHFFETLESGAAGADRQKGADGVPLWRRHSRNPSLEEIEARYPLSIKTYSFRPKSGGTGEFGGGDGVTKSVQLKQGGILRWHINEPLPRPEGVKGGKAASAPEVILQRQNGKREKLEERGELELQAGDTVTLHSAGGGGYGEPVH